MILQGKGYFIQDLLECEGGDPASILAAAQAAGLSHVLVKIADGIRAAGINRSGQDIAAPVVQTLHSAGIAVWGWHPIQGRNPAAEAAIAIARVQSLNLDGYVLEAKAAFKLPGMAAPARQFMETIHDTLTVPVALSSYRFPDHHPQLPWSDLLKFCDLHMPQLYWEQAHNSVFQLIESMHQCDALPNARPYFPTGVTYGTSTWKPSSAELLAFMQAATALGLPGVNFFNWELCRTRLPAIWSAIADFVWPIPDPAAAMPAADPATPAPFLEQFLAALNSCDPQSVVAFYDTDASQVWADQIRSGAPAIQAGYAEFFNSMPIGLKFSLTRVQVENDAYIFAWLAGPLNGETTLVLKDGRIALDYTFIT